MIDAIITGEVYDSPQRALKHGIHCVKFRLLAIHHESGACAFVDAEVFDAKDLDRAMKLKNRDAIVLSGRIRPTVLTKYAIEIGLEVQVKRFETMDWLMHHCDEAQRGVLFPSDEMRELFIGEFLGDE